MEGLVSTGPTLSSFYNVHNVYNVHDVPNVHNVHDVHIVHLVSSSIISQFTTLFQLQTCLFLSVQLDDQ